MPPPASLVWFLVCATFTTQRWPGVIQAISAVDLLQVQYAKQDQAIAEIVRKLPPLKTSFPEDLFYPFTNDATSTQALPLCALLLVALLSLAIM